MRSAEDVLATLLLAWVASVVLTSVLLALVVTVQSVHRALVTGAARPASE